MTYSLKPMPSEVNVDVGERSHRIIIGSALLPTLGAVCRDIGLAGSCLLVSDSHVDLIYGDVVARSLKTAGFTIGRAVVPAGEESKSGERLFSLYGKAIGAGLDRSGFVVALGGGVVGDLAGFLAATYLRGVRYAQVPTSLLAMVDSSVGGKTGINLPQGKNLVGAFYQPAIVVADTSTLKTLPTREYISGLAEVVKYGIIRDAEFFGLLEAEAGKLKDASFEGLERIISRCCAIKAEVVSLDERESGLRAILNFGHTLGHALERVTGYGHFLHGEAVAIGMAFAARLSVRLKGLSPVECNRIVTLMVQLGLPVSVPDCQWREVRAALSVDKKSKSLAPRFVLAERIGAVAYGCEAPESALEEAWDSCRA